MSDHKAAINNIDSIDQAKEIYQMCLGEAEGAESVWEDTNGCATTDFRYLEYELFKTNRYGYILRVNGGPMAHPAPADSNSYTGHQMLYYISNRDARELMSNELDGWPVYEPKRPRYIHESLEPVVRPMIGYELGDVQFPKVDEEMTLWWDYETGKLKRAEENPFKYGGNSGYDGALYDCFINWVENRDADDIDDDNVNHGLWNRFFEEDLNYCDLNDDELNCLYREFYEDEHYLGYDFETDLLERIDEQIADSCYYPWFLE